jgi:hypothetical protein
MIACRFERKQAKQAGTELKECQICSAVENNMDDDQPMDNTSPDGSGRESSLDMDGFTRPTMLPRRFRSNTQGNLETSVSQSEFSGNHSCRSFSVEEESEDMDEDHMDGGGFRSRRVSI